MTIDSSTATTGATSASGTPTQADALSSISSNYNEFLTLLTTQLKNQDPSNPMDTSQFTSELAQFAGVEQQVSTNTNLTSLIQLTQSQQVLAGSTILGKQVDLNATTLPLQNGAAHLDFTSPTAQSVNILVTDANGNQIDAQTVSAAAGKNGWDWNGQNSAGQTQPDGAYTVSVAAATNNGSSTALAFTTRGTVTGVAKDGSSIDLSLGNTTIGMANVADVEGS